MSDNLGLAPEEAKAAAYEAERRVVVDERLPATDELKGLCNACHSLGRVVWRRRTRPEWELLIAMHRGWYPLVDRQVFRRMGPAPQDRGPDGRPPDARHPSEKAVDHLAKTYPFQTRVGVLGGDRRWPRIEGTWALSGHEVGRTRVQTRRDRAVPNAPDEFTHGGDLRVREERRTGEADRSDNHLHRLPVAWPVLAAAADSTVHREVMFVDRDWRGIEGRWFTGGYDEIGMDVQLRRAGTDMTLLGVERSGLQEGRRRADRQDLHPERALQRAGRPPRPRSGVSVTGASVANNVITATVTVADAAAVGPRDVVIAGAVKPARARRLRQGGSHPGVAEWNLARTGGVNFPRCSPTSTRGAT